MRGKIGLAFRAGLCVALLLGGMGMTVACNQPPSGAPGGIPRAVLSNVADYTFMWWTYGWRGLSPEGRRVFSVQTSRYGFAFDVDRGSLTHLGPVAGYSRGAKALPEGEAVAQSNDVVLGLPTASLRYTLQANGVTYQSAGFDLPADNARIIESGKFMQRMELLGLRFEDAQKNRLEGLKGSLEILCWPDRASFMLHLSPTVEITVAAVQLDLTWGGQAPQVTAWGVPQAAADTGAYASPDGLCFAATGGQHGGIAFLNPTPGDGSTWSARSEAGAGPTLRIRREYARPWGAQEGQDLSVVLMPAAQKVAEVGQAAVAQEAAPLGPEDLTAEGIAPYTGALAVRYDRLRGWYEVALGRHDQDWDMGNDLDQLERVRLTLHNPDPTPRTVRLNFAKDYSFAGIVGMSPMLRDEHGYPIGLPVQISKDWHGWVWFHGLTMLTLPPQSRVPLEFALAYARWGGAPAASHAQLCLVGWGTNQLWDESALGSYGESICYDPDVNLKRSMIDDVRPLMVWSMAKTREERVKWGWTNNVGGGDFLVYYNMDLQKQYLTRMRTHYQRYCSNLTEVTYAGVTADGHISARITVSTPRSDDVVRGLYRLRYDVLQDTPFKRLAFFQLGADGYNNHQFERLARGNGDGLIEAWKTETGGFSYKRTGIACEGLTPWFALYGGSPLQAVSGAWANRGLVIRAWRARLGGQDAPLPYAAIYGTADGMVASANVELSAPPGVQALQKGDFVEAEVEMVVMPQFAEDYYGPNAGLRAALAAHPDSWETIWREARGNDLQVKVTRGQLEHTYPLRVRVDARGSAELTVRGGVGYVPITFVGLADYRGPAGQIGPAGQGGPVLERDDGQGWQRVDQSVHGADFWQSDYDPVTQRWEITYNLPLDTPGDVPQAVRLRLH